MKCFGYRTIQAFYDDTTIPPEKIVELYYSTTDWDFQKRALKHPNCPKTLHNCISYHRIFYKRLSVMCFTENWKRFEKRALHDPSVTVRSAMYKRLLLDCPEKTIEVVRMIKYDLRARKRFNHILKEYHYV